MAEFPQIKLIQDMAESHITLMHEQNKVQEFELIAIRADYQRL